MIPDIQLSEQTSSLMILHKLQASSTSLCQGFVTVLWVQYHCIVVFFFVPGPSKRLLHNCTIDAHLLLVQEHSSFLLSLYL